MRRLWAKGRSTTMEKYKVTLTVEERQALDRMVSSGKAAARKLVHARILLLGDEGPGGPRCTDEEIVEALNLGLSTIVRVRRRFVTWTLELLADKLIALGCFPNVSRETVRQALKKTTSSPGS